MLMLEIFNEMEKFRIKMFKRAVATDSVRQNFCIVKILKHIFEKILVHFILWRISFPCFLLAAILSPLSFPPISPEDRKIHLKLFSSFHLFSVLFRLKHTDPNSFLSSLFLEIQKKRREKREKRDRMLLVYNPQQANMCSFFRFLLFYFFVF